MRIKINELLSSKPCVHVALTVPLGLSWPIPGARSHQGLGPLDWTGWHKRRLPLPICESLGRGRNNLQPGLLAGCCGIPHVTASALGRAFA